MVLEDAFDLIYKGQTNVAVISKKCGLFIQEMKSLFKVYVDQHPIDSDIWKHDVELGWPYIT